MSLTTTLAVLRGMPLFRHLDAQRLRIVALSGRVLVVRPGERLWEKGAEGDAAYIVLDGAVEVLMPGEEGETAIAEIGAGEIVGEMAVLTGNPRSTAIAARTDTRLLRLEGETVLGLLREFPELSLEVIRILAARLEEANARLA